VQAIDVPLPNVGVDHMLYYTINNINVLSKINFQTDCTNSILEVLIFIVRACGTYILLI